MLALAALIGMILTGLVAGAAISMAKSDDEKERDIGSDADVAPARIDDFDAATDQIVVLYDPVQHPNPSLTVAPTGDGQGSVVMLDGIPVAELPGVAGLLADAVRLTAETSMAA